jgi:hypothetical protein
MEQTTNMMIWGNGSRRADPLYRFGVCHPPSIWTTMDGLQFNDEICELIGHAITTGIFDTRTHLVFIHYLGFIPTFEEVDGKNIYVSTKDIESRRKPIAMTTVFDIPISIAILRKMETIKNIKKDIGKYTKEDLPEFITDKLEHFIKNIQKEMDPKIAGYLGLPENLHDKFIHGDKLLDINPRNMIIAGHYSGIPEEFTFKKN